MFGTLPTKCLCFVLCRGCIFLKEAGVRWWGLGPGLGLFSLQEKPVAASLRGVGTARLEFGDKLLHFTSQRAQVAEHCG